MDGFRENGLKRRRKWRCKVRRIDWGFIGVMVFFAVLMCLIALALSVLLKMNAIDSVRNCGG